LQKGTSADLIKFVDDNFVKYWSQLNVEIHYNIWETKLLTDIPHALFNGVLRSQYTTRNIDELIDFTISQYRSRKVPFTWWVYQRSTPRNLGELLTQHGLLHLGVMPSMGLALSSEPSINDAPEGFEVHKVRNDAEMESWGKVLAQAYNLPGEDITKYCAFFPQVETSDMYQHFIGIYDGQPVAAGTLFISGSTAGLYNIGTIPEARLKGFGTYLTQIMLLYAYQHNSRLIAMQSYPIAVEVCQKLGFKQISEFNVFIYQ